MIVQEGTARAAAVMIFAVVGTTASAETIASVARRPKLPSHAAVRKVIQ